MGKYMIRVSAYTGVGTFNHEVKHFNDRKKAIKEYKDLKSNNELDVITLYEEIEVKE